MSDLRSVVRSLSPEEKQRLKEGLRSVTERLTPLLTEQPAQESIPEGGAFSKASCTSSESKSR